MRKAWITAGLALMLSCVGSAVPAQTTPQQPQDVLTPAPKLNLTLEQVPQVKSHRFFLTAQQIVIVDPKDNKVADVIKLGTD